MKIKERATQVLLASCGVNLCIGVLYAWSIFKNALVVDLGWTNAQASMPYTIAIVVLSLALLVAGFVQDKIGPKRVLIVGTSLAGAGLLISSINVSPIMLNLTFGVLTGGGIGFAYACLNPSTMKWFHSSRKGYVNGTLATAFGIAAVYLAPLTSYLIEQYGINTSLFVMGCSLLLIALPLACTIDNPPKGYVLKREDNKHTQEKIVNDIPWHEMLKTRQFYMLWLMYAFASAAGLMVIVNITSIAAQQANIRDAAYLVVILAIFNSGGRLAAGLLSDKIGGIKTLSIAFILQSLNMLLFSHFDSSLMLMVGTAIAGVGYGTLLAVFPSIMADFYGLKNYGANYGVLYTAWGVGGFIGPVLAALSMDNLGNYSQAYLICAGLVLFATFLSFLIKPYQPELRQEVTA